MQFAKKPTAKKQPQYTQEQVHETGCCFTLYPRLHSDGGNKIPLRSCSEPKARKINLTIGRRGFSQSKETLRSGCFETNKNTCSSSVFKGFQSTNVFSSLTSKMTTQKNSLRNSRAKECNDVRPEPLTLTNRYDKYLPVYNDSRIRPQDVTFNHPRSDLPNNSIQILSEISMVEEEFISQDSATLKALNLLSRQSDRKGNQNTLTLNRMPLTIIHEGKCEDFKDVRNPLQRLLEKKRNGRMDCQRQRLHL